MRSHIAADHILLWTTWWVLEASLQHSSRGCAPRLSPKLLLKDFQYPACNVAFLGVPAAFPSKVTFRKGGTPVCVLRRTRTRVQLRLLQTICNPLRSQSMVECASDCLQFQCCRQPPGSCGVKLGSDFALAMARRTCSGL